MIQGSLVALVTPMKDNGGIDWSALDGLVDWHIESGTDAIVAVGTTGESATLDFEEHEAVLGHVIKRVDGRVPVIAGTGANNTREAVHLTTCARDLGADACLLVTPYYNKPTQEGLYRHYMHIADAVAIPQILYNVPGRTACDLRNETTLRLTGHPHIVGIKDATADVERGASLIAEVPDDFAVYSGDDGTAVELILRGARGNISVTANVVPELMHQLCAFALQRDADSARELQSRLNGLHQALFLESNPIPVKWALYRMGRIGSTLRLPLTELSAGLRPNLEAAMSALDLPMQAEPEDRSHSDTGPERHSESQFGQAE